MVANQPLSSAPPVAPAPATETAPAQVHSARPPSARSNRLGPNPLSPNPQVPLGQTPRLPTPLLLLAPLGQLSGDGQLRELIKERRGHGGGDAQLWYLPPFLLVSLGLGSRDQEGIVALDTGVITWLQLRFGGVVGAATGLDQATLAAKAQTLPSPAPLAALGIGVFAGRS